MSIAIIIPAYKPTRALVSLIQDLQEATDSPIVIVNDGSGESFKTIFKELESSGRVQVLSHYVNLGKGAALRTALNHCAATMPGLTGAVTADADGQHLVKDIIGVSVQLEKHPESLILGTRSFGGEIPLRSALGNKLTRLVFQTLTGTGIHDTQTGLRGIPIALFPALLRLRHRGYEFELKMLICTRENNISIREVPISTVYLEGNQSSHFRPIMDSILIYAVFLRFFLVSVITAGLDFLVFISALAITDNILMSMVCARVAAGIFNFQANRSFTFKSKRRGVAPAVEYTLLVLFQGVLSYGLLTAGVLALGGGVIWMKLLAEGLIFIASFIIQNFVIFSRGHGEIPASTDWDAYYDKPFKTAHITRRFTLHSLVKFLNLSDRKLQGATIVECGGANSCFFDHLHRLGFKRYTALDNNQRGLDKFAQRCTKSIATGELTLRNFDLLSQEQPPVNDADICYSVGLIEHFHGPESREFLSVLEKHFAMVRDGGLVVIAFPTPTWLYRASRRIIEMTGLWAFPDEIPLTSESVHAIAGKLGTRLGGKTLWSIILTQHMAAYRKLGPLPC
ncbi:MAG: GtrA family protein [Pseudomonadota bacterium]